MNRSTPQRPEPGRRSSRPPQSARPVLPTRTAFAILLCLASVPLAASGCAEADSPGRGGGSGSGAASLSPEAPAVPDVLASIGETPIRMKDLPAEALEQLVQLDNSYRQQRHELLSGALDAAIAERLVAREAEARGVTPAELVAAEMPTPPMPTDAEVEAWYQQNRGRLQGRSLDEVREQIRTLLHRTRVGERADAFDATLRSEHDVTVHLDPYRVWLDNSGAPALGPEEAEVTLVEFSDFECPFCGRFHPTLERIEEEYGDRVKIVYRQFPIPSLHPAAFKAAEASLCAHEQGEFWAYHDLLFQEQERLAVRDLKEKAGRLGLDRERFDECLDTGRYVEQVQDDQAAGRAAGVTGTPALFVNGIPIPGGAVDFEVIAEVLDEELARAAD